ncbi:hypothetical protein [Bartonella schoenbuchensis]|nr:hypothetical protein [Bartonella schoenbuchensis]
MRGIKDMKVRGCIGWLFKLVAVLKHMGVLSDIRGVKTTKGKNREDED